MSPTDLRTILLVSGALGKPDGFDPLLPYLEEAGFTTHPGPYPSCDPVDPTAATCEDDIAFLRSNVLLPLLAFATPATAPGWADKAFDGKRAYVRTLNDCCNPTWLQDSWLEKSEVQWNVIDFNSGHMLFVS